MMKIGIDVSCLLNDEENISIQKDIIERLKKDGNSICIVLNTEESKDKSFADLGAKRYMHEKIVDWLSLSGIPYDDLVITEGSEKDLCVKNGINFMISDKLCEETYKSISKLSGFPSIDKPWLCHYSDEIINSEIPALTAYEYLYNANKNHQNDIAIEFFYRKISYKELFDEIDRTAKALIALGIKKGDVITSCLPNIPESAYLIYAANKIGAIIDLIDPFTSKELMKRYCNNTNSKIVFTIDACYKNVENIQNDTNVQKIVVMNPLESTPIISLLLKLKNAGKNHKLEMSKEVNSWKAFINESKKVINYQLNSYAKNEPFAILHTGGTTGVPKGALQSNDNINALAYQCINSDLDMKRGESALNLMPPFASYGLANGLHVNLVSGTKVIMIPTYEPHKIDEQLIKFKPNRIACSPAHYEFIANSPLLQNFDLSFLRHPIVGGDSLNIKLETDLNNLLLKNGCNDKIAKGYGSTESCSGVCVCSSNKVNKLGSVGIPFSHTIISCFDFDDCNLELPYNCPGEICISSPNVMLEYYNNREETNKALIKHNDGKIWLHSGDLGHINENGEVFITGRMKRMIIQYCGLKSNPFEAEETILSHKCIENVVVLGIKDPYHTQGEIPVAFVTKNDETVADSDIKSELIDMCKQKVTYYSNPMDYVFLESFPKTNRGKVDIQKLKSDYECNSNSRKLIKQNEMKF